MPFPEELFNLWVEETFSRPGGVQPSAFERSLMRRAFDAGRTRNLRAKLAQPELHPGDVVYFPSGWDHGNRWAQRNGQKEPDLYAVEEELASVSKNPKWRIRELGNNLSGSSLKYRMDHPCYWDVFAWELALERDRKK